MKTSKFCKTVFTLFFIFVNIINLNLLNQYLYWKYKLIESKITKAEAPIFSYGEDWITNGVVICNIFDEQISPQICSDQDGGAIITWEDHRALNYDIYAQRINATGDIVWTINGTAIYTYNDNQFTPQICTDGAGGAIISWADFRNGNTDIYAQRIDSNGAIKWNSNGVAICNIFDEQISPQICSDQDGGAIITWRDHRALNYDIYAQRIDSNGITNWTSNGTAICTASNLQSGPQICSDGEEGAVIVWEDFRNYGDYDIYAQKINSTGNIKWQPNGKPICMASDNQNYPKICNDGFGGAIITWTDWRKGYESNIYTQRINSSGDIKWINNGLEVCTAIEYQGGQKICNDNNGGAIIIWEDNRNLSGDIYAQKYNSTDQIQWDPNGTLICGAEDIQVSPQICSDNEGGAIITWEDCRAGFTNRDIYVQRINSMGYVKYNDNGSVICTSNKNQREPQICSDGLGGGIICWEDERVGSNGIDIYAQRIRNDVPTSSHPYSLISTIGHSNTINWTLYDDCGGQYRVLVYHTDGNFYVWVDWTPWINNIPLNIPINRIIPGVFHYTIEFYDDHNQFGTSDTVIVTIELGEDGRESPLMIISIAIISILGGIGAAIITFFLLRKRKLRKEGI